MRLPTNHARPTQHQEHCRGIPRGCVEVGQDHGGLEPRNLKNEGRQGGFRVARSSEQERTRSHAREQTRTKTSGASMLERVFLPNHRCSVQRLRLASERGGESRETRVLTNTEGDTAKQVSG